MKRLFNVETVIIGGGPTLNSLFFERDLFDEVNIILFPCSGSGDNNVGIFGKGKFKEFDLIGFKKYEGGRSLVKINCEKDSEFYLSAFYKNKNHEVKNEKLANFIFKYFSSVNNKRAEYSPKSNKIDYSFNDGTLKLKFDPLYKDNNFIYSEEKI